MQEIIFISICVVFTLATAGVGLMLVADSISYFVRELNYRKRKDF